MTYAKAFYPYCGLVAIVCATSLGITSGAFAKTYAVYAGSASKEVSRLERQLREAKRIEAETKRATEAYGRQVGRWVSCAHEVGWSWEQIRTLTYIIYRESRGNPKATNASSGAAGLLQFMPQWYTGQWSFPAFDPYNPKVCLTMGLRLYRQQGWTPWAL